MEFRIWNQRPTSPLIIPIFLPNLGCRERCIFCNQRAVAPDVPSPAEVRKLIKSSLSVFSSDRRRERQIAFYGGSFTAIPKEDQSAYLKEGHSFLSSGWIDSIRVSTRPDALDEEVLSLLKKYGVKTVELGAQSMIDEVLLLSRRGHSSRDTVSAVSQLKHWGFEVGLHVMIGLPGDSFDSFSETLDQVIRLNPDFLRIHPTLVLKEAPIETLWAEGKYSPLTLEEAIRWLKRGLLKLEKVAIPVARIGLQLTKDLEHCILAGPCHPALRQLVDSEIYFDMAVRLLDTHQNEREPCFICHPSEISSVRGQKNENLLRLKKRFGIDQIHVQGREDIPRGSLLLHTQKEKILSSRNDFA